MGFSTAVGNLFYFPAKIAYGTLGGLAGGAAYVFTRGDHHVAHKIWRNSLGGDYLRTPTMLNSGPAARRFIQSHVNPGCVIIPIAEPIGTQIGIVGLLKDTLAIPSFAPNTQSPAVSQGCFNVEAFTVGLASVGSEFDPQDPANIIDAQGYGFAWLGTEDSLRPGSRYAVAGCGGHSCPTTTAISFNTVTGPGGTCTVMQPLR
jgi:hypothetical protein